MGLDMFLSKETSVGANYSFNDVKGKIELTKTGFREEEKRRKINIKLNRVSSIKESVGYWRKANQIHNWFVNNIQDGIDECQESYVPLEMLVELRDICRKINKTKSQALVEELLPPSEGFFFGGTEVDDYYFEDIKETLKILNPLIKELEKENKEGVHSSILYQASW